MERGAVLCVECGFDRRIGRRRKTKVKRMERDWTPPPGVVARIVVLVVVVMLVGLICFGLLMGGVHPAVPGLVLLSVTGLGVLLAGWYHTLHLRRDRVVWVLTFLVPIAFFSIFAIIFSGQSRGSTPTVPIALVDQDGSELSKKLVATLQKEPSLRVTRAAETGQDE